MWEISPTLVRHDTTEPISPEVALAGLRALAAATASAKVTNAPLAKPISNFYQTDAISRAYVRRWFCAREAVCADVLWQVGDDGAVHARVREGRELRLRGGQGRARGGLWLRSSVPRRHAKHIFHLRALDVLARGNPRAVPELR
jgi:hypothetical protein